MKKTFLLIAIMIIVAGNLASQPNQSTPAHRQEIEQEKTASTAAAKNNCQYTGPAQSTVPQASLGNITDWPLVIVGIITCGVVGWQSLETRRSAQAALRYVMAFIESQRPIIAAAIVGNPTKELHDREAPRIRVALSNKGATTAYEVTYQSWIELLPFPFTDFTNAADHFMSENPYSMYPNHDPIILNIPIRNGLSEAQLKDLRELKLYACVRVRVAFRDAFTPTRYSNFGVYVMHEGMGWLPKYNDSN